MLNFDFFSCFEQGGLKQRVNLGVNFLLVMNDRVRTGEYKVDQVGENLGYLLIFGFDLFFGFFKS
jgi:hypothetical protein